MTRNLDTTFRATDCRNKRVIEWIDIKNVFPPNSTEILFFTKKRDFFIGSYELTDTQFFTSAYGVMPQKDVTHWANISGLEPVFEQEEPVTTCQDSGVQFNKEGKVVSFL